MAPRPGFVAQRLAHVGPDVQRLHARHRGRLGQRPAERCKRARRPQLQRHRRHQAELFGHRPEARVGGDSSSASVGSAFSRLNAPSEMPSTTSSKSVAVAQRFVTAGAYADQGDSKSTPASRSAAPSFNWSQKGSAGQQSMPASLEGRPVRAGDGIGLHRQFESASMRVRDASRPAA